MNTFSYRMPSSFYSDRLLWVGTVIVISLAMHSTKQSNWVLGLGIFVAILLIITMIWFRLSTDNSASIEGVQPRPEIGLSINNFQIKPLSWLSSLVKTLN